MKLKKKLPSDRTFQQIKNHYEVEKAIAIRLKKATREERKIIYRTMYDELFKQVPDHPILKSQENLKMSALVNQNKLRLVEKFINNSTVFVEFGPGDCRFALSICNRVRFVYGVDISDQRGQFENVPDNFKLIIYDGYDLQMQENSTDVVFSDQLIEHLHPEDTELHFQLVRKILRPQGVYVFRTPHRFSGPHDVSRYFSDEAEGFHLKEWTYSEIVKILKRLKYSSWSGYKYTKRNLIKKPFAYFIIIERILNILPKQLRKIFSRYFLSRYITMVVIK
ncbi:class I SAM-dependent methyltransferase [bacterium]|nr:class I SAM-dependent methyltransferase [bacterium]